MKKMLFAIFAHPDDEAFGPSGALLMESWRGTAVHMVLLTAGEAGRNPDNAPNLGEVRLNEWRKSGELIGAAGQHFLGYKDGQLNNQHLETIGRQLVDLITNTVDDNTTEIEIITNDTNGVTGHIDHIVAARAALFAFYKLKQTDPRVTQIRLSCLPYNQSPDPNVAWIYADPGRSPKEVDQIVDARQHQSEIIEIMKTHHSQREDCQCHLKDGLKEVGLHHFVVKH